MPTSVHSNITLPCPFCGVREPVLKIDLNELRTVECETCGETFTVKQAVKLAAEALARWEAMAEWLSNAPNRGK